MSTAARTTDASRLTDAYPAAYKDFYGLPSLPPCVYKSGRPYHEGTGALYLRVGLRVGNADKRTVLLTAAHIATEEIIALGDKGYRDAVTNMQSSVRDLSEMIMYNGGVEDEEIAEKCQEVEDLVNKVKAKIKAIDRLHNDITRSRTTPEQRTIGFVLHVEPIAVSDGPHQFIRDWVLIELYEDKIVWDSFNSNQVYVGKYLSPYDYREIMFPRPEDHAGYMYLHNGLLQANGVVKDKEMHSPQYLDANGCKCLRVVKNSLATGTTVGHVNGLDSFTCVYTKDSNGSEQTAIEVAVLPYDRKRGAFSAPGDSGAIVLERGGGIVGMLTGGGGKAEDTDITYLTPYWWLEEEIKKVFPGFYLYDTLQ